MLILNIFLNWRSLTFFISFTYIYCFWWYVFYGWISIDFDVKNLRFFDCNTSILKISFFTGYRSEKNWNSTKSIWKKIIDWCTYFVLFCFVCSFYKSCDRVKLLPIYIYNNIIYLIFCNNYIIEPEKCNFYFQGNFKVFLFINKEKSYFPEIKEF